MSHRMGIASLNPSYGDCFFAMVRSRVPLSPLIFATASCFIDFYGPQRLLASRILGLRATRIVRGRFALTAGFPTSLCEIYLLRAIRQGVVVLVVREDAARHSRVILSRFASTLLIPVGA
jgi:hypothetical protein